MTAASKVKNTNPGDGGYDVISCATSDTNICF
jgi:hypothetical protein